MEEPGICRALRAFSQACHRRARLVPVLQPARQRSSSTHTIRSGDSMTTILVVLSSFSSAAQAHESLVPHTHPHGVSMLPGIEIVACGLLVLAAALIAYRKFRRTP